MTLLLVCSMYKYVWSSKAENGDSEFCTTMIPTRWQTTYRCHKSPHFSLFTHHLIVFFVFYHFKFASYVTNFQYTRNIYDVKPAKLKMLISFFLFFFFGLLIHKVMQQISTNACDHWSKMECKQTEYSSFLFFSLVNTWVGRLVSFFKHAPAQFVQTWTAQYFHYTRQ